MFTTVRDANIRINKDDNGLKNLQTLERNLNILDFYSAYSETIGTDNSFSKNLGRLVSIGSPPVSYKINSIEYNLGVIDKDRRNFRNFKTTSSAIIGFGMGKYHPAIGYISGKASDKIFDAVEFSADYLNNGFNQLKNQIIFRISNNYK